MSKRSGRGGSGIKITEKDLHPHLKARMQQRGVTQQEIERALNEGQEATDAKPGTFGKVVVLPYQAEWEGKFYEQKEVTVYYKIKEGRFVFLTVKARYGRNFSGGE
jgi:hypothetical protein